MPRYRHEEATEINGALLPAGTYEGVVKKATNKISKAERKRAADERRPAVENMIELIVTCYGPDGESDVFDYLVFDPSVLYKVRHFCDSAGIDFTKDQLDASECVDRNVRARVAVKTDPEFGTKNEIKDYLLRSSANGAPVIATKVERDPIDADIPF